MELTQEAVKALIDETIKEILTLEWTFFKQTENQGGPASCQEDWDTFQIQRSAQFLAWTKEIRESYLDDLRIATRTGRNLITEKYGRMMESNYPEEYEKMKDFFPTHSEERKAITLQIAAIQVEWLEEFAKEYPDFALNARRIHSTEDTPYDTSAETYLRGELDTYSDKTLILYGRYIAKLKSENKNLTKMIFENIAKGYGYKDLASAKL